MTRWDAARAAAQRITPTKRKPIGPVGENRYVHMRDHLDGIEDEHCNACGYHICGCEHKFIPPIDGLSPCPPCPECGHEHRFGGCAVCRCSLWDKPGALRTYNELLEKQREQKLPGSRMALASALAEGFDAKQREEAFFLITTGGCGQDLKCSPEAAALLEQPIYSAHISSFAGCATPFCGNPAPVTGIKSPDPKHRGSPYFFLETGIYDRKGQKL